MTSVKRWINGPRSTILACKTLPGMHCLKMKFWKRNEEDRPVELFLENGRIFLEELIADCNGKSNPICIFSSDQILRATNDFDPSCYISRHGCFTWYRGIIEDRVHAIKTFSEVQFRGEKLRRVFNDIAISTRVSNHRNFLKLLGCCLEFPLPVLVYEYAENGVLDERGCLGGEGRPLLPWKVRMKIAKEVASAVTYLHTAFPRIIIHRNIKPTNIFLDKNWDAKLTDFSISISLPEGKSWAEDIVMGTFGYIEPSYLCTGLVTEYIDVFSFGVFLMVLLIGRPASFTGPGGSHHSIHDYVRDLLENGEFIETIDQVTTEYTRAGQRSQIGAFRILALRCCENDSENRPKMIEVAKALKWIERLLDSTSIGLT